MKKLAKKSKTIVKKSLVIVANPGKSTKQAKFHIKRYQLNKNRKNTYKQWFEEHAHQASNTQEQRAVAKSFARKPLISIILPIYNTPEEYLRECIESVISQSYENWELCVADDASTTDPLSVIKELASKNKNIKWVRLEKNQHIAGASGEALKLAKGEYVALLDHDDLLMPNALFEMVKKINENPEADFIYSDEDKIEDGKGHSDPFFKPDWSPDFLRSCNYITHFSVIKRDLVESVGGFRLGTEGAQDWDLFLRLAESTDKIFHVPKILYSWRKSPSSTAKSAKSKPYAYINQLRVLRDSLVRQKSAGAVMQSPFKGFWRVHYRVQGTPLVSIVIPTKDNYSLIKNCVESIVEKTTYPFFEIVIVDTGSTDKKAESLYNKWVADGYVKVVHWKKPFNFAGACNLGANKSSGEYLLFLNNDTEVITPEWIENMLGHAQRSSTGMVGCMLMFPDDTIQHAGVVLSSRDIAFHPFYGQDPKLDIFTNIFVSNTRNCAAVTAACSMVAKSKFKEAGGFDEKLSVTYNDVDLCLKLLDNGYQNVYTPYARLYHYESRSVGKITGASRDKKELAKAANLMRERWGDTYLKRDPYYNDNFAQYGPGYEL